MHIDCVALFSTSVDRRVRRQFKPDKTLQQKGAVKALQHKHAFVYLLPDLGTYPLSSALAIFFAMSKKRTNEPRLQWVIHTTVCSKVEKKFMRVK